MYFSYGDQFPKTSNCLSATGKLLSLNWFFNNFSFGFFSLWKSALFLDIPREIRQQNLQDEYGFMCCCDACTGDYPTSAIYPWTGIPVVISEFSKAVEWKTEFAENCLKIVENQDVLSHSELCLIMMRNLYLLVAIAKSEPFIF